MAPRALKTDGRPEIGEVIALGPLLRKGRAPPPQRHRHTICESHRDPRRVMAGGFHSNIFFGEVGEKKDALA